MNDFPNLIRGRIKFKSTLKNQYLILIFEFDLKGQFLRVDIATTKISNILDLPYNLVH